MDEKELLKMLSSNRNEAYEYLYNNYYTPLVLFADHYVSNQEVAHDLVQETFIALLDVKTKFENLLHLKSYLYNSLRNAGRFFLHGFFVPRQHGIYPLSPVA